MLATIVKFTDVISGKTPLLEVTVKKLDGTEKAYKIAKFKEALIEQFNAVEPGDNVDIQFKEEKGFMNVCAVKKHDGAMTTSTGSGGGARQNTGTGGSDKMSKAEWQAKDMVKNRGVALRFAIDTMPLLHDEGQLANMDYPDFAKGAITIADLLLEYITKGSGVEEAKVEPTDADVPTPDTD
jgi:hypothetical protein